MNNNKITKKRVAQTWGIFMLASLLFTSCLKNQEDFFDESASARMTNTINKTKDILRNSEYGWEFEYYPDRDLSYGGLVYTVKFDSLDATIGCSLIPDSTVTTYYRITNDNGPVLTFDTYNPLMHYFATPSAGEYEAKDGDFEFVIEKLSDDEIVLYGKRTRNTMYLRKLKYSPAEYAAKTIAISDNFIQSMSGTVGESEVTATFDLNVKSIEFIQGTDTITSHFTFNDEGIRLYAPLNLSGMTMQSFAYDMETNRLTCLDAGCESVSFQGVPHGDDYMPYSQYEGKYKLRYHNNLLEATISLVPSRIDGTFRLTGLSPKYELILNYDFNTGELTLGPQWVGVLNDGESEKSVYFLTTNVNDKGVTETEWIGEDCTLKLVWNKDKDAPVFTFEASNPDKYPCNSAELLLLFYDENDDLRGAEVKNKEWFTNETPDFQYLNSLTKLKE
ncbi:MAG: DUF4302 domain-containing protein [Bacteroidaceae bacterium]|nr:DUF4302 domain-containing protein [Bacteroidaceae bacterium]